MAWTAVVLRDPCARRNFAIFIFSALAITALLWSLVDGPTRILISALPLLIVGVPEALAFLAPREYRLSRRGVTLGAGPGALVPWEEIARVTLTSESARFRTKVSGARERLLILPTDPTARAEAVALLQAHLPETAFA